MAGRPNVSTGVLPSTYGMGAYRAQGASRNAARPLGAGYAARNESNRYANPTGRTTGGNSYSQGNVPGKGVLMPERVRPVRSAGYGQGKLAGAYKQQYRPNAPFHVGTPANLQRPEFDNWSAKKKSLYGETGTGSKKVYWSDLRERDEKMKAMRMKYDMHEERAELVREAFNKLDFDGDGKVTINDLKRGGYNHKGHPMFKTDSPLKWTEDQVYHDLIARLKGQHYEPGKTERYQVLTYEDFEEYYSIIGEELDDDYFAAMMISAWGLKRHLPSGQGWNDVVLDQLMRFEANLMGDTFVGIDAMQRSKLDGIVVSDVEQKLYSRWQEMVASRRFDPMHKAAEEIADWVQKEELVGDWPHPLPTNAVMFFRLGGAGMLADLAMAEDGLMKRTVASTIFWCLKPEIARIELEKDQNGKSRLMRDGLPAICLCTDGVARNKAERAKALLLNS
mmetsp:Transcript_14284/g.22174  ORF Transcript_14284/g.22174 Transcript_14284/m.22174 type:complete len:449 (+) Transcript_14284:54-1400(+)|eukprot:CAMPEP_0184323888 /NCGR_PEP_ID=MMETSP1049-20130417/132549_1 /TAXON_ID=77928 /ORGANISM="Proteomonas sulcata, Strain CCMP704" /LENGTH=448 /DNA_ID=CAMNT_0026645503 /DNA_START=22 /DNA_END=1368 /DNA_ORIENTATION=+